MAKNALVVLSLFFSITIFAQKDTVIMQNMSFKPESLTISKGSKVVWVNKTNQDHTSTSGTNCTKDGKWNSGYVTEGKSFSRTFDSAGTFNYFCIPHCLSGMKGAILVKESNNSSQQNETLKKKEGPEGKTGEIKRSNPSFKSSEIINAVTTRTLDKGILDFSIFHRFDNLSGPNGGPQIFFGLDNIRDFRFSFSYGLFKNVTLGLGRSKGDWFNTPYQVVKNIYDASVKIRLSEQNTINKGFPFSIAVYANTAYTAMEREEVVGSEANFQNLADRFSHSAQVIIAHDLPKYLSLQIMPVYLRRNWVNTSQGMSKDELDLFSLGGGLRWGFSDRFAIISEYFYVFSRYRQNHKEIFSDPLAVGVEINTGGHVFHINLSNATGLIPNTFIPYTTSSWLKNGFRLGFSISRKFVLKKKT